MPGVWKDFRHARQMLLLCVAADSAAGSAKGLSENTAPAM
jgi:hypothetical protein